MRGRLLVTLVVAACGRLGFDGSAATTGDGRTGDGTAGDGVTGDGNASGDAMFATPVVGTINQNSGVTTVTLHPTAGATDLLIVAVASIPATSSVTSMTDARGNAYVSANARITSGTGNVEIWYSSLTNALAGDTVTVLLTTGADASVWGVPVSNMNRTAPFDHSENQHAIMSGAAAVAPTVATTRANEVLVSLLHVDVGGVNGTAEPPFQSLGVMAGDDGAYLITAAAGTHPGASWPIGQATDSCSITAAFFAATL